MSNQNWLERRRQAARCKIHGLHFDPQLTAGCALCRKEGLLTKKHRGPQLVILLLALLGMTVVAFRMFGPNGGLGTRLGLPRTLTTATTEPPSAPSPALVKLDSEDFRNTLQDLEGALFKPQTTDLDTAGTEIDVATDALSAQLLQQNPADAQEVARAISILGDDANLSPFTLGQLEKIRARWLRLRQRHFQPAPWLTVPETSPAALDPAMVLAYREIASRLVSLIQLGATEARTTSSTPPVPANATESLETWRELTGSLREEIEKLRERLPQRPGPQAPTTLLVVIQDLEQTLGQLKVLAAADLAILPDSEQFNALAAKAETVRRARDELLL